MKSKNNLVETLKSKMKKYRKWIAPIVFIIFYITFGTLITVYQEKMIYQPSKQDFNNCSFFGNDKRVIENGTQMYYYNPGKENLVILYHGNAGSACDRAYWAQYFTNNGYAYLIPEYYGYSNGVEEPSHQLIKKDVENVIQFIKDKNFKSVIVIGESIGTGMAVYHASLSPPDKILLVSPFSSVLDIARKKFWFYPVSILVDNAFDNVDLLSKYSGYVTIVHGDKDEVIDLSLGKKLFESLSSVKKKFVTIKGSGHNNIFDYSEMDDTLNSFLFNKF